MACPFGPSAATLPWFAAGDHPGNSDLSSPSATAVAPAAEPRSELAGRAVAWLLPFALTAYLALSGGGYDPIVRSEIGVLAWWVLLLCAIAGLLPRFGLGRGAWLALAALAGFLVWTWIAASWSQSEERTLAEVARVATYLGVFLLAACALTRGVTRPLLNGLACGIVLVCGLAVLSRLIPSLFPSDTASKLYATARLSYPFDYSDGVGEFAALGLPLLLCLATGARTLAGRALAAAGLPLVLLCLAMTVSRGGILAAAVGILVFFALAPDRIPRLGTLVLAAAGAAVLLVALLERAGVRNEYQGMAPAGQRHSMLVITIVVLVATAAIDALFTFLTRRRRRPAALQISRRRARAITTALLATVVVAIVALAASGTVHSLWEQFKRPSAPTGHSEYVRLLSISGSHRYQYWQAAVSAFRSHPVKGIGPGTFEFYWAQHNTLAEFVRNAHSLWIETLAEAGVVGFVLILTFFVWVLGAGAVRALRVPAPDRTDLRLERATAVAGVAAFCAAAAFDWVWQIGVIPLVAMLLAAVAVGGDGATGSGRLWRPTARARIALGLAALPALWAIAVPLATTVAVRSSQSAASQGNFRAALDHAASAQQLEPGAASPRLQRALVLEQLRNVSGASQAIAAALAREPTNWRIWLVASRIATEADQPATALSDYRRARALNPTSPIFRR